MRKRIRYFKIKGSAPPPKELKALFSHEKGKLGYFTFDYGSEREREFVSHCKKAGLEYYQFSSVVVSGRDIASIPFFYLHPENDKNYHREIILEPGSECRHDGFIYCKAGGKQIRKIEIDPQKVKKLDIMQLPGFSWENKFIITRRLKELLERENVTGYRTLPCLTSGLKYTEKERAFDFISSRLEEDATHFQLVVSAKARKPEIVIGFASQEYVCEKCGVPYLNPRSLGDLGFSYYRPDGLSSEDFQTYMGLQKEGDSRVFYSLFQKVLFSGRVLHLFLQNKIRGIFKLYEDPPIKHAVVEVVGETCDEAILEEARRIYESR